MRETEDNRIIYKGKVYKSLRQACKELGLNYHSVRSRINRGWSIERALTEAMKEQKTYVCQGVVYPTLKGLCDAYEKNPTTVARRINELGWTVEEAIFTPVGYGFVYECIEYESLLDACKKLGKDYELVRSRIKRGWSREKALSTPLIMTEPVVVNGITYKSLLHACNELDKNYDVIRGRIKNGMSIADAFALPVTNNHIEFIYKGILYKTLKEACKALGLPYGRTKFRVQNGWTIEEALSCPGYMSLGECRIRNILEKLSETYFHNKTIKYIFEKLDLSEQYDVFMDTLVDAFEKSGYNWTRKRIASLRYDFAVVRKGEIYLLIEFDGVQHFQFVHLFFKTLEQFLYRHNADEIKTAVPETKQIPLLRIRYDQIDFCEDMIMDALNNPSRYLEQHNTYLTNEEYWDVFENVEKKLKIEHAYREENFYESKI